MRLPTFLRSRKVRWALTVIAALALVYWFFFREPEQYVSPGASRRSIPGAFQARKAATYGFRSNLATGGRPAFSATVGAPKFQTSADVAADVQSSF